MFAFSIPLVQELPVTKEMNKLRKKKKKNVRAESIVLYLYEFIQTGF